jgi:hypothetical protein
VFDALFAAPHGRKAYARYLAETATQDEPVYYAASARDVVRLRDHLETAAALEGDGGTYVGLLSLGGSVSGFALGTALALDESLTGTDRGLALGMAFGAGTLMLGSGLTTLLGAREGNRLLAQLDSMDAGSAKQRAQSLEAMEARLSALVERYQVVRQVNGGLMAGGGAIMLIPGVLGLTQAGDEHSTATTASSFVAGVGLVALGVYLLTEYRFPIERTWELYLKQRDAGDDPRAAKAARAKAASGAVKVAPNVSTSGKRPTPTVGVQGSF